MFIQEIIPGINEKKYSSDVGGAVLSTYLTTKEEKENQVQRPVTKDSALEKRILDAMPEEERLQWLVPQPDAYEHLEKTNKYLVSDDTVIISPKKMINPILSSMLSNYFIRKKEDLVQRINYQGIIKNLKTKALQQQKYAQSEQKNAFSSQPYL